MRHLSFKIFLSISVLATALLLYNARHLQFNNKGWIDPEHSQQKIQDFFEETFEGGENIILAFNLPRGFYHQDVIEALRKLSRDLEKQLRPISILSPLSASLTLKEEGSVEVISFDQLLKKNGGDLEDFRRRFEQGPYHGRLIDLKGRNFILKASFKLGERPFFDRQKIRATIEDILDGLGPLKDYKVAGELAMNHKIDESSRDNVGRLLALALGAIFVGLWFFYGSLKMVGMAIFPTLTCVALGLNTPILMGHNMTIINTILVVLVAIISLTDTVHIFDRFFLNRSARETIRQIWPPCLMTSLSTGIGIGSLALSQIIPLRNFAWEGILLIPTSYAVVMVFNYVLLEAMGHNLVPPQTPLARGFSRAIERLYALGPGHLHAKVAAILALALVGVASFFWLKTESNFLNLFFRPSSTIYQDFTWIDKNMGGTGSMEILFAGQEGEFQKIQTFRSLLQNKRELLNIPEVLHVSGQFDAVEIVHEAFKSQSGPWPTTDAQLAQEMLLLEFSRSDDKEDPLRPYVNFDYSHGRIGLQTKNLNSQQVAHLLTQVKRTVSQEAQITGVHMLFFTLNHMIVKTQVVGLLVTIAVIALLFAGSIGLKGGLLSIVTNLIPLGLLSLLSVAMQIPLDFATILIASIGLGICVDDSVHIIHYYHALRKKAPGEVALKQAMRALGRPLMLTSVLFTLGFACFMASDLHLFTKFGLLSSLAMVGAFFSCVVSLPLLLRAFDYR